MSNNPIFLATLGQRPEAITVALDALLPQYGYEQIVILHTDPAFSGVAQAFRDLMPLLRTDYPECDVRSHEIRATDGSPLIDIVDQRTAEGYFYGLADVIREYRQRYIPVHLLVSGGRKAMSIYATVAATYLFSEQDRVLTVLTEPQWMQAGVFHLPPGQAQSAQVVALPLLPTNVPAGVMTSLDAVLNRRSPRGRFLATLSKQETALAEAYKRHPYASNEELGRILKKAERTIENQFRSIYGKMLNHFDMQIEANRKRQVLLDILNNRL